MDSLVPIMLLKLPVMLWSNFPEFRLLCSHYGTYVNYIVCSTNSHKIMSISNLHLFILQFHCSSYGSSSTV